MAGEKSLLVILGPTSSGKTDLAIQIARRLNGEIIGADSRQVYRQMDIGTAKPTPEQFATVPHHLFDIVDPDERLALATYQRTAYEVIDAVHQRGRLPMLVGGTGQYITAVAEGWSIPEVPPDDTLRAELETFAAEHGSPALHERLAQLDPTAAAQIDHRNVRRVIRALEVCILTGQQMSELQRKRPPPFRVITHGLTLERDLLYARADTRVDQMMQARFLDEVRALLDRGYDRKLPSMSGLGYAQLAAHILDGAPLETAVTETKHATHDFIRRQYTWFRGHDSGILWHNIGQIDPAHIVDAVTRHYQELP
ncbi:MAG: tRNA (adenosine(37)-N6)-dimethylallyltransferase MiaA [Anaerolineae bacterium]|nr:tRNA (adenosine(37)-N6)-dimethylallyltransferase MiaA [Anaerolineae bacterium]